jgi:hypothetical protein
MDPNYAAILQANVGDVIKMVEKDGWFVVSIAYGLTILRAHTQLRRNILL